jgi:subtilase family serine protease
MGRSLRFRVPRIFVAILGAATLAAAGLSGAPQAASASSILPTVSDWQFVSGSTTPPSQAACNAVGRRCFDPFAMANSYNYAGLHTAGNEGQGTTIALVDSFGSAPIANDLNVFDTAFGLPHMCGEPNVTCTSGMPQFSIFNFQGSPPATAPPPNNSPGQEAHNLWALEVSLDVEWAHATAPLANIMLVTTPTAETLGVQGLPQMMQAEKFVIDNHMADVISQSFGTAEEAFSSTQSLLNLRYAFEAAQANDVTMLASSGDSGSANIIKTPVHQGGSVIPFPTVGWPASDPLVTGVGGTYLCTDATTGTSVDSVSPPANCQSHPGVREVGWIDAGGGFSHVFSQPSFQNTLPPGSTAFPAPAMRGVPDVAYQASSRTGVLVYDTEPATSTSGVGCGGANPCSTGWYVVGGTSCGSPQWAGIIAMTDQIAGRDVGYINPALYQIADNPSMYANDFYDVTVGNNQADPSVPGYNATTGWDPVTGLGTPNVANLIPDLIAAT